MSKIPFTKKIIDNLEPVDKRTRFTDSGKNNVRGLFLIVTPTGNKSFYLRKRLNNKILDVLIGQFPSTSVLVAKQLATKYIYQISQGINPNEERSKEKNSINFQELYSNFVKRFEKMIERGERRKSTLVGYKGLWNNHYSKYLANIKISSFKDSDAKELMLELELNKTYSIFNRGLVMLRAMYSITDTPNCPFNKIKKLSEISHRRNRYLNKEELEKLFIALEKEDIIYQDIVKMLLLTGVRKSCVLSMLWQEIDFENATWTIPLTKMKAKKAITIPLSREALEILNRRKTEKTSEFVFPSRIKSNSGHVSEKTGKSSFWRRITIRAGLFDPKNPQNNLRVHDLRHTLATWMVNSGGSIQATSKLLGHSDIKITASTYAHLSIKQVRNELEATTKLMLSKKTDSKPDKLEQIKKLYASLSNDERSTFRRWVK